MSRTDLRERAQHPATAALELATVMRTVGDPIRLQIVRTLADERPRACGELSDLLGLPNSTLSYHLRLLRDAGLTRTLPQGAQRLTALRREDLDQRFPGLLEVLTQ
ncbi:ArsR/SmtB family transcription factor [Flexivirga meconopsidis]|uniref:ArsR/SmtB family transcription factor n=1 Tax=Flexivirga meconopsidis TaxID=2977121 RepID=UPI00223F56FC|nr:metalloregulator ArsR/SmtB family transcription factor [Flexivirga meconopsidis]